jgi:hypothetical protein
MADRGVVTTEAGGQIEANPGSSLDRLLGSRDLLATWRNHPP